ncbi:hypothetical protein [Rhodococcoides corynebacterioides]|uniref:Uncharacterized protein n=1 Tax=Rhodococcoides corynebacterioides TaxID=53972 RepID=A0ABS7P6Q0_9NOCA|nr:hypothetical protein [Rhodococcus corynebacterioides]MBY6368020.1 hypothetical protein [Rhodococcus corynebacterioides]MBY6407527.1 hypothetical protein [Rhodococcus corynebacterioides]
MVAVSLTNEWTSTHASYLEWLSIDRATKAGRYQLVNGNQASNPHTPEPLEADCHEFLETIAVLLATLGAPILEPILDPVSVETTATAETIDTRNEVGGLLYLQNAGCQGRGRLTAEGLLVLKGSRGRGTVTGSASAAQIRRREARQVPPNRGNHAPESGAKDPLFEQRPHNPASKVTTTSSTTFMAPNICE